MKLSVLAALIATVEAIHQESKQHQLVATKTKLNSKVAAVVKNLLKNSKNIKLIEV